MLEVQRYNFGVDNLRRGFTHVGYMNKVFSSKRKACGYYNQHQPHMPPMDSYVGLCSDWDTATQLRYVVRHYTGEYLGVASFEQSQPHHPTPVMGPSSL